MSNSPTVRTSTTASSSSSPSRPEQRIAVVACGAIATHISQVAERRGWPLDLHPLPPLLHNHPGRIARETDSAIARLVTAYAKVIVGYADCGTYGALDEICERHGVARLPGLHCYDVFAGAERLASWLADQPGTYLLTDFLVRSFDRTVWRELGLERHPELRADYFGHYTRVIWLAQEPDGPLRAEAEAAASRLGLPLVVVPTGLEGLEAALAVLLAG